MTLSSQPDQSKGWRAGLAGAAGDVPVLDEAAAALEALRASLASSGLWKTALTMVDSFAFLNRVSP
jgi:hypothetical protein